MKIWLDDRRPEPEGWVRCYTPEQVIELLEADTVTELSLDHDLGLLEGERERTGYDVLLWIEEQVALHGYTPPAMTVHSANSVAHGRMQAAVDAIQRLAEAQLRGADALRAGENL